MCWGLTVQYTRRLTTLPIISLVTSCLSSAALPRDPSTPAAAVDNVEVARCLLEAGASTEEVQAGTLNRPLHLATFQGSYGVLTTLLEVRVFGFECLVSLRRGNYYVRCSIPRQPNGCVLFHGHC